MHHTHASVAWHIVAWHAICADALAILAYVNKSCILKTISSKEFLLTNIKYVWMWLLCGVNQTQFSRYPCSCESCDCSIVSLQALTSDSISEQIECLLLYRLCAYNHKAPWKNTVLPTLNAMGQLSAILLFLISFSSVLISFCMMKLMPLWGYHTHARTVAHTHTHTHTQRFIFLCLRFSGKSW